MEDEANWVITSKGDHEEEISQFDGETLKKMIIKKNHQKDLNQG